LFSKEEVQVANKYMKKCSSSLAIKEMQTKMTMRFHLTPSQWQLSRKHTATNATRMCVGRGTLIHFGENVNFHFSVNTMEISMEVPQKPKIDLLCVPAISFLGIHLKECKSTETCTPMFITALSTIAKL
jgi:hypothetical protein